MTTHEIEPTPVPAPPDAEFTPGGQKPRPADPAVVTLSRYTLNYLVIGVTSFLLGAVMTFVLLNRAGAPSSDTEALLTRMNATYVAALPTAVYAALPESMRPAPTRDPNARYSIDIEGRPFLGAEDAPVTMVAFEDFRCGFCRRFIDETIEPLRAQYGDNLRYVHLDYPILGPESVNAANAAACADVQGAFWEFHDRIYTNQDALNREAFIGYATELGLDTDAFTACYDSSEFQQAISADYNQGSQVGVTGTPTFFINGRIVIGALPVTEFQRVIDEELVAAGIETAS